MSWFAGPKNRGFAEPRGSERIEIRVFLFIRGSQRGAYDTTLSTRPATYLAHCAPLRAGVQLWSRGGPSTNVRITKVHQAQQNAGAMAFRLTDDEMAWLDELSRAGA